jgi:hypothetical protein
VAIFVVLDVAGEDHRTAEFGCHFGDAILEAFVLVGESEFGTFPVHGFGDPVGDRAVGQQSGDQNALAGEKAHVRCLL